MQDWTDRKLDTCFTAEDQTEKENNRWKLLVKSP